MSDTKDPKNQSDKEKEEGHNEEDKERDDILNSLREKEGQQPPRKSEKEKTKEPEPTQKKDEDDSEDIEDIESFINEKITDEPNSVVDSGEELGVMPRVVGVFTSPQRVFQYLSGKPDIWIPIIISIIAGIVTSFLVYDIALDDTIAAWEHNENIPDEQRNTIIDSIESRREGTWRYASIFVFPIIGTLVIFALVALAYWFIGNVILGGKVKYKQVFSVFGYSYLIMAIAGTIVKVPLILSKGTIKVHTSLAVFMSSDASQSSLYRFLDSIDLFTIWFLVVFAIGYAIIYRFSQMKAFMGVFISWLIYVLVFNVALGSFFSRFTGQ